MKKYPKLGEKLTLVNSYSGSETPYVVEMIINGKVIIREAVLVFHGPRYFDTVADEIVDAPGGNTEELTWSPKYCEWRVKGSHSYYVKWGVWKHVPFCD